MSSVYVGIISVKTLRERLKSKFVNLVQYKNLVPLANNLLIIFLIKENQTGSKGKKYQKMLNK